jgi:hypothetical protein
MKLFMRFLTESLVPLQSRGGLMFRRRMMGTPIFNVKTCGGMPGMSAGLLFQTAEEREMA